MKLYERICNYIFEKLDPNSHSRFYRFIEAHTSSERAYKMSYIFARTIDKSETNPSDVRDEFIATVNSICEYLGYGKIGRLLVSDMYYGGWKKINPDTIELAHSPDYWRITLKNDIFYCSDRWNFGRLLRCIWAYNMWARSSSQEGTICHEFR